MSAETKQNMAHEFFDSDNLQSHWGKIKEIYTSRHLLRNLVVRDLKVRYKNSALGIVWSLLHPLLMMLVYTLLFTKLRPGSKDIPYYPVFILVALVPWQFLTGSLSNGVECITGNAPLIKKVYFPRIILPMSTILSNFVNFLFAFGLLVVILFIARIGLTIHAFWVIPLLIAQVIFMLGLILILSSLNTFYRDVSMILSVVLLAWFFLTPVFYPFEELGAYAEIWGIGFSPARVMRWVNPMASIVDGYRTVLWGNVPNAGPASMDLLAMLRIFATSILVLFLGYAFFLKTEHLFGEKL
ncbi:MAG: ABC transporter permease [Chloroflexi bacterium]|nr:ABC transporter permease [Chloroflexota bacterium]